MPGPRAAPVSSAGSRGGVLGVVVVEGALVAESVAVVDVALVAVPVDVVVVVGDAGLGL